MKKRVILYILAGALVLLAALGGAWAYFTTYVQVKGGYPVEAGSKTTITETFSSWTKHLSIRNSEGSAPVFVRARGYSSSRFTLYYSDASGKWTEGEDGWYYYGPILNGGETADTLEVGITGVPDDPEEGESFHVVVVYESTPVLYRENGEAYADWNVKLDGGTEEGQP